MMNILCHQELRWLLWKNKHYALVFIAMKKHAIYMDELMMLMS